MNAHHAPPPQWIKSSYSTAQGGNCVETTALDSSAIGVRDSKAGERGHLTIPGGAWEALTASIRR